MTNPELGTARKAGLPITAEPSQTTQRTNGWSAEDVRTLISMWSSSTNAQIAKKLGRAENAIAVKATRLKLPRKDVAAKMTALTPGSKPGAKIRDCLTCRTPFYSEGSHNRICDPCKESHSNNASDYFVGLGGFN